MPQVFTTKKAELLGLPQVKRNVERVLNKTTAVELKYLFLRAGTFYYREARAMFPVKSGRLQSAIFIGKGDKRLSDILVGINQKKAPHAHLVEYGHFQVHGDALKKTGGVVQVGTFLAAMASGKVTGETKGHPFMRPAWAATRPMMQYVLIDGMKKIIADAAENR